MFMEKYTNENRKENNKVFRKGRCIYRNEICVKEEDEIEKIGRMLVRRNDFHRRQSVVYF